MKNPFLIPEELLASLIHIPGGVNVLALKLTGSPRSPPLHQEKKSILEPCLGLIW
jgi:hypothetical protein